MKHKFKPGDLVTNTKSTLLPYGFVGIVISLRERYAEPKNIELVKIYITCVLESSSPRRYPRTHPASRSGTKTQRLYGCNTIEEVNITYITHATPENER